jgi:uncharacterized membrane protein
MIAKIFSAKKFNLNDTNNDPPGFKAAKFAEFIVHTYRVQDFFIFFPTMLSIIYFLLLSLHALSIVFFLLLCLRCVRSPNF